MQMSSDKRQQLEQQLRKQLEDKVKELEEGKSNSRGKTKNDQQIIIATLQADLAQVNTVYCDVCNNCIHGFVISDGTEIY